MWYNVFTEKTGGSYEWRFFCYLDSYQVLALLSKLKEIKNKNPFYDDPIVDSFFKQVIQRGGEIATTPNIVLRFSKKASLYKLPKSMVDYINNITDTDVFDEKNTKEYIEITNRIMEEKNVRPGNRLIFKKKKEKN